MLNRSEVPPRRAENTTVFPSGLNVGDSGASTLFRSNRCSILSVTTFWMMRVSSFSVRAKYAMRSPTGAHENHGTMLPRMPPATAMYSKPRSLSKPFVRFRTTDPSRVESRTMSNW